MKKVLAVSGGLDSMVLLHRFKDDKTAVVAHFNHGTRPSAQADQIFVERWAKKYGKDFITETAQLGADVSEDRARAARYEFLCRVAQSIGGELFTAHHADDLLESVVINLLRGTGWRGLAPFYNIKIKRPLLTLTKNQLREYAAQNQIVYREDPTNNEPHYLRNRVRAQLIGLSPQSKGQLLDLASAQTQLRGELEQDLASLLPPDRFYPRAWFQKLDDAVALEILRAGLAQQNLSATRPQLQEFLTAIRTYAPGKQFNLPGDRLVKLHKDHFML